MHVFALSDTCVFTSINSNILPLLPQPPPSTASLRHDPKLARQTLPANNTFPYLGFIPVAPRLTGWLECLRDDNTNANTFSFQSVQRGNGWAGPSQLVEEWSELESRLAQICLILRSDPVPSPTLEEEDYPMPSTFGYTRTHKNKAVANRCLGHSRDAFFPLIARASYFLFFLKFPAINGPLLRWLEPTHTSSAALGKRPLSEPSSTSSKRLHREDLTTENPSTEDVDMDQAGTSDLAAEKNSISSMIGGSGRRRSKAPVTLR